MRTLILLAILVSPAIASANQTLDIKLVPGHQLICSRLNDTQLSCTKLETGKPTKQLVCQQKNGKVTCGE